MKEKTYLVAIAYDSDHKCKDIHKVMNVGESDFKQYVNEKNAYKQAQEKLREHQESIRLEMQQKITKHEYLLAKSIYDNFVDRGLFDDDQAFQQMYYEHIFEHKEFDLQQCPQEFLTILEYVRGA